MELAFYKNEGIKTILCFGQQAVLISCDTTAGINNRNKIGNLQGHLVSLHTSKMNLLVGDIHVNLAI